MNFSCIFLLALAVFGTATQAYIASGTLGCGTAVGAVGYNGLYDTACGAQYGTGYGAGYGTGYGCRTGCAPVCASASVCDSCQCLKTVVRPNIIERIPYSCGRRIQTSSCRSACGLYPGAAYGGVVGGVTGGVAGAVAGGVGGVGGTCSGYMNGGYLY